MAKKSAEGGGVTGGGEFSESGSEGRTSTTMGNKRFALDCAQAGEGCSLKLSGTYDEVLAAGLEHGRSVHQMKGSDAELREDIKGYIHEDVRLGDAPGPIEGRGRSQAGPSLPS